MTNSDKEQHAARKAFEEWATLQFGTIERDCNGQYEPRECNHKWQGFQAGRESMQPEIDRLREVLDGIYCEMQICLNGNKLVNPQTIQDWIEQALNQQTRKEDQ